MSTTRERSAALQAGRPAPDAWDLEAKQLVRSAMQLRGYTYKSLANALELAGEPAVSHTALGLRISRGTFTFGFALQVLRVMGVTSVDISHIKSRRSGSTR